MSERAWKIWLGLCVLLAITWFAQNKYFDHLAKLRMDREALEKSIERYMACRGPACDKLYPDGARAVKKAEAEAAVGQSNK